MEYPVLRATRSPHPDMPADILPDYEEARSVFGSSKRGSAALLRLVIQKLCISLGQPGKNLNADIRTLVANGLPPKIQQSLDDGPKKVDIPPGLSPEGKAVFRNGGSRYAHEFVRARRAQLALRKRRTVIPELPECEVGEIFLGEIGEDETKEG